MTYKKMDLSNQQSFVLYHHQANTQYGLTMIWKGKKADNNNNKAKKHFK